MAGEVTIAWPRIRKGLYGTGDRARFLLFRASRVKGSPPELMEALGRAMQQVDDETAKDGQEIINAQGPLPGPRGPLILIDGVGTEEDTQTWLNALADALREAGLSGAIGVAPTVFLPEEINGPDYAYHPRLTAFLAYSLTETLPPGSLADPWLVNDSITRELCRHAVSWGGFQGATTYLSEGLARYVMDTVDVDGPLFDAVTRLAHGKVVYCTLQPIHCRTVAFQALGQATYQVGGEGWPWQRQYTALREVLSWWAEWLDAAVIQPSVGLSSRWAWIGHMEPKPPSVHPARLELLKPILRHYLPDAYPMQLVTDSHLEKAHDLSSWSVTEVTADRYLLETLDPEPWYAAGLGKPDPDVVERARRDFGEMLLTDEIVATYPDSV